MLQSGRDTPPQWGVLSVKGNMEERAQKLALYIIENKATVRAAAGRFGISKSTVHTVMLKWNGVRQARQKRNAYPPHDRQICVPFLSGSACEPAQAGPSRAGYSQSSLPIRSSSVTIRQKSSDTLMMLSSRLLGAGSLYPVSAPRSISVWMVGL